MQKKKNTKREKVFCFLNNCIRIDCVDLSQLISQYLSSPVSVLTNSPKILPIAKRDFSQINVFHIDQ